MFQVLPRPNVRPCLAYHPPQEQARDHRWIITPPWARDLAAKDLQARPGQEHQVLQVLAPREERREAHPAVATQPAGRQAKMLPQVVKEHRAPAAAEAKRQSTATAGQRVHKLPISTFRTASVPAMACHR